MKQKTQKEALRRALVTHRRQSKKQKIIEASAIVCERLLSLLNKFERIGVYAAFRGELRLDDFIEHTSASLAFPRACTKTHHLSFHWSNECPKKKGAYGIAEPSRNSPIATDLQVIVVPGVAFTSKGDRLGMGGGYYDRFLQTLPTSTLCVGVGYDWQIVECVFAETHDVKMTHVLTEKHAFYL